MEIGKTYYLQISGQDRFHKVVLEKIKPIKRRGKNEYDNSYIFSINGIIYNTKFFESSEKSYLLFGRKTDIWAKFEYIYSEDSPEVIEYRRNLKISHLKKLIIEKINEIDNFPELEKILKSI